MLTTEGSYAKYVYMCVYTYTYISEIIENCVIYFQIHQKHGVPGM